MMRQEFLTVQEATKVLRVNRGTLLRAIRRGEVPVVRIGRCLRIPARWLQETLDRRRESVVDLRQM